MRGGLGSRAQNHRRRGGPRPRCQVPLNPCQIGPQIVFTPLDEDRLGCRPAQIRGGAGPVRCSVHHLSGHYRRCFQPEESVAQRQQRGSKLLVVTVFLGQCIGWARVAAVVRLALFWHSRINFRKSIVGTTALSRFLLANRSIFRKKQLIWKL
jgi:hypothetical protein